MTVKINPYFHSIYDGRKVEIGEKILFIHYYLCVCVTKLFCTSILKKKKHNHISEKKTYLFSVDFLVTIDIVKGMK